MFSSCCCLSIWYFLHLFCIGSGMKNLNPPLNVFFQIWLPNYACNFVFFFSGSLFLFFHLIWWFIFMLQVQSLFVIKLGNIVTSINMFVVCIHFYFFCIALHFILHTHFLHEERKGKWVILAFVNFGNCFELYYKQLFWFLHSYWITFLKM